MHVLRSQVDAVIVGVGTVLADDPQLTVRPDPGHQPLRVVLDTHGRAPETARVFDDQAATWQVTGGLGLPDVLDELTARGVVHVLLEGGPTLAAAFLRAGLVDAVRAYVAPALLGAGPPAVADLGILGIGNALRLELLDVTRVGDDIRLDLRPSQ